MGLFFVTPTTATLGSFNLEICRDVGTTLVQIYFKIMAVKTAIHVKKLEFDYEFYCIFLVEKPSKQKIAGKCEFFQICANWRNFYDALSKISTLFFRFVSLGKWYLLHLIKTSLYIVQSNLEISEFHISFTKTSYDQTYFRCDRTITLR